MKMAAVVVCAALLAGCTSLTSEVKSVDWVARETTAQYSSTLAFGPEAEPLGLRIPLLAVSASDRGAIIESRQTTHWAPFGVWLGNAVAIDSQGNIFLDLLQLLKVDMHTSFTVTCRSNDLFNNLTTLAKNGDTARLSSPLFGSGTVALVDSDITVTAAGKSRMTFTKKENQFAYRSGVVFDTPFDMSATADLLTVSAHALLGATVEIESQGDTVVFNSGGDPRLPVYTIGKTGDMYLIGSNMASAMNQYKLYCADNAYYLVHGTNIMVAVAVTSSEVRVNGSVVATFRQD
jgi:hypothetical protein